MTAEVAVLSKSAIAVAADSAVTRGRNKVHVSANKIFQLHKTLPIGILIYNYAEIYGLPWELIAKTFREQAHQARFNTLDDCCTSFLKFLHDPQLLTDESSSQDVVLHALNLYDQFTKGSDPSSSRSFNKYFHEIASKYNPQASTDTPEYSLAKFRRNLGTICRAACDAIPTHSPLSARNKSKFVECVHKFAHSSERSDYFTGFAVFGYGEHDLLPRLNHYIVDGAPFGALRIVRSQREAINRRPSQGAAIFAFAQRDAASLFMEGISPDLRRFFLRSMQKSLEGFSQKIFSEVSNLVKDPAESTVAKTIIDKQIKDFMKQYQDRVEQHIHQSSVAQVMASIDGLGKEDMAKLAESIVELASLKKKVSREIETVGGPIDVAVASKNDGFVWIKRKLYFDFDLNKSFYLKYHDKKFDLGGSVS